MKYEIWFAPDKMRFCAWDFLQKLHLPVCSSRYEKVYEGNIAGDINEPHEILEALFRIFNTDERPADYKLHSMSVSDVVVLCPEENSKEAWFVDSFGHKHIPEFFQAPTTVHLDEQTKTVELEGYAGTFNIIERLTVCGKPYFRVRRGYQKEQDPDHFVNSNGEVICAEMDSEDWGEWLRWDALDIPVMPDPTMTMADMRDAGYCWPGMLPLSKEAALKSPVQVYRLYDDGSEGAVDDYETEIAEYAGYGGIFGIEKVDWLNYCNQHGAKSIIEQQKMPEVIDLHAVASEIVSVLENCGFNDCTDSSGFFVIKEFHDGAERCVDVYKSHGDKQDHYVVYCSYEDEDDEADYRTSDDLSVESLEKVLRELAEG